MLVKATEAANYLIYLTSDSFDDMTNMKINKLLYYAQGYYLRKYGVPMFEDTIEAWEHGPVVASVYDRYKDHGDSPVTEWEESQLSAVSEDAASMLLDVAREYGRYTASTLRNMTHVING